MRVNRPGSANDGRRLPVPVAFRKWKRGGAEGTFGEHPPDHPVGAPAAWTVVDFAFAIDGVIAPRIRIECFAAVLE